MIINTTGVDADTTERVYIKQEGELTLKVVRVTEGKTQNNNPQIKVHFQDKQDRWAFDEFVITPNAMWKVKIFTKALKLPNVVDTNLFIARYVKATFGTKKTANGEIYEIKKYEASPLTNTYEPQQQAVQYQDAGGNAISQQEFEHNQQQAQNAQNNQQQQLPINDGDDEIPF
jgi:hypothetical protein